MNFQNSPWNISIYDPASVFEISCGITNNQTARLTCRLHSLSRSSSSSSWYMCW